MINVMKANGTSEPFSEEKVLRSIKRTGIPPGMHQQVLTHVKQQLYSGIPTATIYHHIVEFLEHSPQPYAKTKYTLKQAMMDLGPTGYPFEDFVAKLLTEQGYTTLTRQVIQGTCITHEIDVIGTTNTVMKEKIMVEAKYHNTNQIQTNVHVSLYVKARFDDVKEKHHFTKAWLITNTKATADAIAYAECVGLHIVSWSYPEGNSLKDMIEEKHLYPITSLTTISTVQKQQLLEKSIVLCKDICADPTLLNILNLHQDTKKQILDEIHYVCNYTPLRSASSAS